MVIEVELHTEFIKLDALLKFGSIVGSGGQAKQLIKDGLVRLNGVIVLERGKKIRPGDEVEIALEPPVKIAVKATPEP
ncbi:MAG: RNA-binding protein [Deltaproteobacteria bacterium RIFOXYA12_FULL_58_15]|nr:MAG: RNA-binding protein [Deltaproteobacteria bacterium RIFOXYA12_FULL_58_15]